MRRIHFRSTLKKLFYEFFLYKLYDRNFNVRNLWELLDIISHLLGALPRYYYGFFKTKSGNKQDVKRKIINAVEKETNKKILTEYNTPPSTSRSIFKKQ